MFFFYYYYFEEINQFSLLTRSRRNNSITFTRDSGYLASDEFLAIREGHHMLIFFCWGLYFTVLAGVGYFQSGIDKNKLPHNFLESPPLLEQCVAEHASAMGLIVKWLTNSQFELREKS